MLKLEATLIATTAARPWRGGWSPDRGVDFIIPAVVHPLVAATHGARIAAEPACFLDTDDSPPAGTLVVGRYVSLAAQAADAGARDRTDVPLTRAWSSPARKLPGS